MTKMARLRKSYFDCLYFWFSEEGFDELFVDKVCKVKKEFISN